MELFAPIPDFDRPIDVLYICHDNILRRIAAMETMSGEILDEGRGAFDRRIDSWREVFSFFEHSVGNHTKDEEAGLFPMLHEAMGEVISALHAEHERTEGIERRLTEQFARLLEAEPAPEVLEEFARQALELAALYRAHIREENDVLFPAARRLLTPDDLRQLGLLMRRHRRIEPTLPA